MKNFMSLKLSTDIILKCTRKMPKLLDVPVSGKIFAITGNVGNGKNTFAVELIINLSKRCYHGQKLTLECPYCIKYGITDRRLHVQANFDIKPEFITKHNFVFTRMYSSKDLLGIKKGHFHQIWIIDEPNTFCFDSRNSMSKDNQDVAKKIQRCRHFNSDTVFLTQLSSMVDLRGRKLFQLSFFAITPSKTHFFYALFTENDMILLSLNKLYAKREILDNFASDYVNPEELESGY